jgi:DNA helicase-2/ATP-dependent DNA helicase PcrA
MGARVLVTTFTSDATEEMRERITHAAGRADAKSIHITTLHAFCLAVLKRTGRAFQLLTDDGQARGLSEIAGSGELEGGTTEFRRRIGFLKSTGQTSADYRHDGSFEDRELLRVWKAYEAEKAKRGLLEFDDLLTETSRLFAEDMGTLAEWAGRYTHLLVDECQDMNHPQYAIVLALAKAHHNLMLVGDADQSLYAFRGADTETFRRFASHPATRVYELRENYRSVPGVLRFADAVIRQDTNRRPIVLQPTRAEAYEPEWHLLSDADEEAEAVAETILRLRGLGARFREMAVLFRENAQSEAIERIFASAAIPYTAKQGGDFYRRREVAAVLAHLELATTHADEWLPTAVATPDRGFNRAAVAELGRAAGFLSRSLWQHLPEFNAPNLKAHRAARRFWAEMQEIEQALRSVRHAGEAIRAVRRITHLDLWLQTRLEDRPDEDHLENLNRLEEAGAHYRTTEEWLEAVRRVRRENERRRAEMKKRSAEQDCVTLATGHGAKGLEWRYVFSIGWSEGLLPHRRSEHIDEERRIAYVMATRARDHLWIGSVRQWNGKELSPSQFLTGISLRSDTDVRLVAKEEHSSDLGGLFTV